MEKYKVVRIDKDGAQAVMQEEHEALDRFAELKGYNCANEDETIRAANDADIIITIEGTISRKVMEALPKLKAVIRYGVGYDTVDVDAATDNHILVVNIPDFCWEEVANHVILMMLAQSKKLVMLNNMVKKGQWAKAKAALPPMASVHGETLGIIGCGRLGRVVASKARCFDMKIIGYDKYLPKEIAEKSGIELVAMDELLAKSDYITIHTTLTDETYHLISTEQFGKMKPTATIINTSRGPVIDEKALVDALRQKKLAAACLDVFEQEPPAPDNPLFSMDNVMALPHSASYSDAAFSRLRASVGAEAARIASGVMPKNVVNRDVVPKLTLKPSEE